jgi:hypothetical protein
MADITKFPPAGGDKKPVRIAAKKTRRKAIGVTMIMGPPYFTSSDPQSVVRSKDAKSMMLRMGYMNQIGYMTSA